MGQEAHRVFALKYRPSTFDEMVGQPHVRQTLVNTLQRQQAGHGYIFSGPRGVGKTTVARLFAKALNCLKTPGAKFCNDCDSCREITSGNSLDVIEMDGASNRKIEDVRTLRENVRFVPASGKHKIYIIDEVHMLTQEAFNALLKTLEEPPPHVVFLLATTDPQKIPDTIHSRCHELEFHRLSPADLEVLLRDVSRKEKISIDGESLVKLAEWADGSARDALVALEQAAAFTNNDVQEDRLDQLFGWVDRRTIESAVEAVIQEDRKRIFDLSRQIEDSGRDMAHFLVQLARHLRGLWMNMMDGTDEPSLRGCAPDAVLRMISSILEAERTLRGTRQPGFYLAVRLTQLIELKRAAPLTEIVRRLEEMEARLSGVSACDAGGPPAPSQPKADPPRPAVNVPQVWAKLVEEVSRENASLAGYLREGVPSACSQKEKVLTAVYGKRFSVQQRRISDEKTNAAIDAMLSKVMGASGWHLFAVLEAPSDSGSGSGAKGIPPKVRAASDLLETRGVTRRE